MGAESVLTNAARQYIIPPALLLQLYSLLFVMMFSSSWRPLWVAFFCL